MDDQVVKGPEQLLRQQGLIGCGGSDHEDDDYEKDYGKPYPTQHKTGRSQPGTRLRSLTLADLSSCMVTEDHG